MASSQHVEVEAAKFLHKLIQESKDEPSKLATKLYVICQHMKISGKEQSLPYQVISRAMETVISQHRLDIDVLRSSRLSLSNGPQMVDSGLARRSDNDAPGPSAGVDIPHGDTSAGAWHTASSSEAKEESYGGTRQSFMVPEDCQVAPGPGVCDTGKHESAITNRLPKSEAVQHDTAHQGSGCQSQRSNKSSEHESPASVPMEDTRSANSQERHDSVKLNKQLSKRDTKKTNTKRKRVESKDSLEAHADEIQQPDTVCTRSNSKKGKQSNRGDVQGSLSIKGSDRSHVASFQKSSSMEEQVPLSAGARQDSSHTFVERKMDKSKMVSPASASQTPKYHEEGEVSSSHPSPGVHKGGMLPSRTTFLNNMAVWNQNRFVSQSQFSQGFVSGLADPLHRVGNESTTSGLEMKRNIHGAENNESGCNNVLMNTSEDGEKGRGGTSGAFSSRAVFKGTFSSPLHSAFVGHDLSSKLHKDRSLDSSSDQGAQSVEKGKNVTGIMSDADYASANFSSSSKEITEFEQKRQGFIKDVTSGGSEKLSDGHLSSVCGLDTSAYTSLGRVLGHEGSIPHDRTKSYASFQGFGTHYTGNNKDGIDERESNPHFKQKSEAATRGSGAIVTQTPVQVNMPFKEQHLKQLRAQCLVFLAFRNNVAPRKLHLEIALGECYTKEDGTQQGPADVRGKVLPLKEPGRSYENVGLFSRSSDFREVEKDVTARIQPGSSSGSLVETESSSKEMENTKKKGKKIASDRSSSGEERQQQLPAKRKIEMTQLTEESQGISTSQVESASFVNANRCTSEVPYVKDSCDPTIQQGRWMNQSLSSVLGKTNSLSSGVSTLTTAGLHAIAFKDAIPCSVAQLQQDSVSDVGVNPQSQCQLFNGGDKTNRLAKTEFPILDTNKLIDRSSHPIPLKEQGVQPAGKELENMKYNVNTSSEVQSENLPSATEAVLYKVKNDTYSAAGINSTLDPRSDSQKPGSDGLRTIIYSDTTRHMNLSLMAENAVDQEDGFEFDDRPVSPPKYTTSEKWILEWQKIKRTQEEKWTSKQRKAEERMTACFDKLKENVNVSEDISAKTKSVIELKKLQLLQLQRRLRSDFLNDFFKPVTLDMDRLKSVKKHRHGRRIKQLEKFEQKMKEERQKRIRERQKEFFGEIEVHRERLEDCFKVKRERCKGFNRYIKEFHKRKERIHKEKIDRIQREKINLLKNNDVEGYLRMVQDAKSDRVKQLLKETEKYLQKLGAKIQDAKPMVRCFEMEMDASQPANLLEKSDISLDPEDETDQAQHYLESNEKYYLMAHSVKETINEQPTSLLGGKLREYQMNGLRWLVSLYNNHLNGILADEMGLGKTVQVISLICYLMETKNDRGPFLVVVPSSVLPGWESEISFWAPGINKIVYAGPPEERRRLFKDMIVHQKFNVLLTTYEYLMNKHDRPKLSKIHWHYVIIDEGHRIKNASCKLNADLKHYQSSHRLLLTGTPLQNNLEELWALLNFLLPNIFNSSEDFSQWFNKPFESNGDNSPDEALLSEEENLLIINRLHQVLRPFVLRRLKHKVENELPEKIERLVRCEASAYQKLLMKRVEDNLGSIGTTKGRSVHNTVMELRNICNHPYLSQLHADEVDVLLPKHYLPSIVRLCGKLEMLDRLLPKLKATGHRVLFFSTMTRLLDVMEEYLTWKHYRYLRLDGHTSGNERGALIEEFNRPDSPTFIFLLSIRAGGVGVNLQAADTVIIFDTDWNPQVDLQAQARAHRIGQKRDVLVLRLETVHTVEEQVRAAAEHKLGVANQSITAGFFDNNTSAEDRREYLESLLRECKKEEASPVLDDDALNYLLARSEAEIDIFEAVDKHRREEEAAIWQKVVQGRTKESLEPLSMPSRLVTDEDLKPLYQAIHITETATTNMKRKGEYVGLDTQQYGRGKRAREVRSYEDQWTEEEFEKLCQVDSPESPKPENAMKIPSATEDYCVSCVADQEGPSLSSLKGMQHQSKEQLVLPNNPVYLLKEPHSARKENSEPTKRGRGRPKRGTAHVLSPMLTTRMPFEITNKQESDLQKLAVSFSATNVDVEPSKGTSRILQNECAITNIGALPSHRTNVVPAQPAKGPVRRTSTGETPRGRGRKTPGSCLNGRTRANKNCVPAVSPSISHDIDHDSGSQRVAETSKDEGPSSQKMADLSTLQSQCSSVIQERHKRITSIPCKMEIQVVESKVPLASVESMSVVPGPSLTHTKKDNAPNTTMVQSVHEQISSKSVVSVSPVLVNPEKSDPPKRLVDISEKSIPPENSGYILPHGTERTVTICSQSTANHSNSENSEKAMNLEILNLKSVDNVRSQDTLLTESTETKSVGMKHEKMVTPSNQTSCSVMKNDSYSALRRGSEKRNSVTSKKAAAREIKNKGSSAQSRSAHLSTSGLTPGEESIPKSVAMRQGSVDDDKQDQLVSAESHQQLKPSLAREHASCTTVTSLEKQFDKAVHYATSYSNENIIEAQSVNESQVKHLCLLDVLDSSHADGTTKGVPECSEKSQLCSRQEVLSDGKCKGNHISDNLVETTNTSANIMESTTGGNKVYSGSAFSSSMAPLSAELSSTVKFSEVQTQQQELNIKKSLGVVEAVHVPKFTLLGLQIPEEKTRIVVSGENSNFPTSGCIKQCSPVILVHQDKHKEEQIIDEPETLDMDGVGGSQNILIPPSLEVMKNGEKPVLADGRKQDTVDSASVDIHYIPMEEGSHCIRSQDNKDSACCVLSSMPIQELEPIKAHTVFDDVNKDSSVSDIPVAGSHAYMTAMEVWALGEGCSSTSDVLHGETYEKQINTASVGLHGSSDDHDACGGKHETVTEVDRVRCPEVSLCAGSLNEKSHEEVCEEEHNIGHVAKLGAKGSFFSSSADAESQRTEVEACIQDQPQELSSSYTIKKGTDLGSAIMSNSTTQNIEGAQEQVHFAVISEHAPSHGSFSEPELFTEVEKPADKLPGDLLNEMGEISSEVCDANVIPLTIVVPTFIEKIHDLSEAVTLGHGENLGAEFVKSGFAGSTSVKAIGVPNNPINCQNISVIVPGGFLSGKEIADNSDVGKNMKKGVDGDENHSVACEPNLTSYLASEMQVTKAMSEDGDNELTVNNVGNSVPNNVDADGQMSEAAQPIQVMSCSVSSVHDEAGVASVSEKYLAAASLSSILDKVEDNYLPISLSASAITLLSHAPFSLGKSEGNSSSVSEPGQATASVATSTHSSSSSHCNDKHKNEPANENFESMSALSGKQVANGSYSLEDVYADDKETNDLSSEVPHPTAAPYKLTSPENDILEVCNTSRTCASPLETSSHVAARTCNMSPPGPSGASHDDCGPRNTTSFNTSQVIAKSLFRDEQTAVRASEDAQPVSAASCIQATPKYDVAVRTSFNQSAGENSTSGPAGRINECISDKEVCPIFEPKTCAATIKENYSSESACNMDECIVLLAQPVTTASSTHTSSAVLEGSSLVTASKKSDCVSDEVAHVPASIALSSTSLGHYVSESECTRDEHTIVAAIEDAKQVTGSCSQASTEISDIVVKPCIQSTIANFTSGPASGSNECVSDETYAELCSPTSTATRVENCISRSAHVKDELFSVPAMEDTHSVTKTLCIQASTENPDIVGPCIKLGMGSSSSGPAIHRECVLDKENAQIFVPVTSAAAPTENCASQSACNKDEHIVDPATENAPLVARKSCIQAPVRSLEVVTGSDVQLCGEDYTSKSACGQKEHVSCTEVAEFVTRTCTANPLESNSGDPNTTNDKNASSVVIAQGEGSQVAETCQPVPSPRVPCVEGDPILEGNSKSCSLNPDLGMPDLSQQRKVVDYCRTNCTNEDKAVDSTLPSDKHLPVKDTVVPVGERATLSASGDAGEVGPLGSPETSKKTGSSPVATLTDSSVPETEAKSYRNSSVANEPSLAGDVGVQSSMPLDNEGQHEMSQH